MNSSRERILSRLKRESRPFTDVTAVETYLPMIPVEDTSIDALRSLFAQEARKAGCQVHVARDSKEAAGIIVQHVSGDPAVSCWHMDDIALSGLQEALEEADIALMGLDEATGVGLTGVDAALAATGSIVLSSSGGRYRFASLVPPVHIAVVHERQILPDLESWWAKQRENGLDQFRQSSNTVIITGPSRTADIALEPVMGMHGPREVHIVLVEEPA